MIITRFKSYPYRDKNRDHKVIGRTEIRHTKPKPNTTKGIRKILAKEKQEVSQSTSRKKECLLIDFIALITRKRTISTHQH